MSTRAFLQSLLQQAVHVSLPSHCLPPHFGDINASNGLCVIGAGKAAADMAAVVYEHFGEACHGAVVTRYGYETPLPTGNIEVLCANHPTPDENSVIAARTLLQKVADNPADVPILFLISGGGSALMSLPAEGISIEDKLAVHRFLLRSGAAIQEMNVVRKQLSAVKGGRLAALAKAPCLSLVISDVVGDDPSLIASGPTVADHSTAQQALDILARYRWPERPSVAQYLRREQHNKAPKTPKIEDDYRIVANAKIAIDAAIEAAQKQGWQTAVISYEEEGEARKVAKKHAKLALEKQAQGEKVLLFSGGELTVSVQEATGQGGPNQEYLLALSIALDGAANISALACDTDGVDGSQDVAGAFVDSTTLPRASAQSIRAMDYLTNHDSFHFFQALDDLIITGPTRTNVNDFRVIAIT